MRIKSKSAWFLAFTAIFAALAGFVFWGTWSLDVVAIMPDAETTYPADWLRRCFLNVVEKGIFHPYELRHLVGSAYFWHELRYVVALYFASLAMVYFCRGRKLGRLASYGAGLLLGFCGYWMTLYSAGHFGWFAWMVYGVFAFGLADRAVRKGKLKHWLLLGAVVSWASFNQQDLWLLFTFFTSVYFIWCCIRERKLPWKGALISLVVFLLIGIPNFRNVLNVTLKGRKEQIAKNENITNAAASQKDRHWEFVTNWSMPIEDALEFVKPRVHGDTSCPFVLSVALRQGKDVRPYTGRLGRPMNADSGNYRQHSLYVGYVTCILAAVSLCAVFLRRRKFVFRSDLIFFAAAAAVFFSLSLGRYFEPAYRVVFQLPFGDLIRCPVKWHHLTEFSLVFMAACGIEFLVALSAGKKWHLGKVNLPLVLIALSVVWGAVNLASEDRRYCAPIDVKSARRANSFMQLAILGRSDFAKPEVAQAHRNGQIVSIANYLGNPNYYLVGVLSRFSPRPSSPVPWSVALWGIVSFSTTLAVSVFALYKSTRR